MKLRIISNLKLKRVADHDEFAPSGKKIKVGDIEVELEIRIIPEEGLGFIVLPLRKIDPKYAVQADRDFMTLTRFRVPKGYSNGFECPQVKKSLDSISDMSLLQFKTKFETFLKTGSF